MSLMLGIRNPYFAAFVGSLFYSLAFCASSSLLSLTSYIASIGAAFRKGIIMMLTYNLGRITAYTLLDSATGWRPNKAPLFRKRISLFGALVLIVLGIGTVQTAMTVTRS